MKNTNLNLSKSLSQCATDHGQQRETPLLLTTDVSHQQDIPSASSDPACIKLSNDSSDALKKSVDGSTTLLAVGKGKNGNVFSRPLAALNPLLRVISKPRQVASISQQNLNTSPEYRKNSTAHDKRRNFKSNSAPKNAIFPSSSITPDVISRSKESRKPSSRKRYHSVSPKATAAELLAIAASNAVKDFSPLITNHIDSKTLDLSKNGNGHDESNGLESVSTDSLFCPQQDHDQQIVPSKLNSNIREVLQDPHLDSDIGIPVMSPPNLIPTRPVDPSTVTIDHENTKKPVSSSSINKSRAFRSKLLNPSFDLHTGLANHLPFPRTPRICVSTLYPSLLESKPLSDSAVESADEISNTQKYEVSLNANDLYGNSSASLDTSPEKKKNSSLEPNSQTTSPVAGKSTTTCGKDPLLTPVFSRGKPVAATPPDTPSSSGSKNATFVFTIPNKGSSDDSISHNGTTDLFPDRISLTSDDNEDTDLMASLRRFQASRKSRRARDSLGLCQRQTLELPQSRSDPGLRSRLAPPPTESRRNSSAQLSPPEDVISERPRRNSAWTAEVLSIEIQMDYHMDPDELWENKVRVDQNVPVGNIFLFQFYGDYESYL
ncbi:hypothetical protein PoB_001893000 [Plakobranchus ocellatus]|uniref:Uncharacterized protein n=1 Tax=Plakobranchus ocellatus TaxID=259542 RepID=A0AAV3ZCZ5_9GAST|nr:hypothetical protein PoB_001893000 [Plakobranchus ocellatus]